MTALTSKQIRPLFLKKRATLNARTQNEAAIEALKHWQASPLTTASSVASFWAFGGELPTHQLLKTLLAQKKTVLLPKLCPNNPGALYFAQYDLKAPMVTDRYGIPSPDVMPEQAYPINKIDVIIMPLVATDKKGNRIGMGKGYYDKTLANKKDGIPPLLIGWCYSWQVLDKELLTNPWDIPMDGVITEKGLEWFKQERTLEQTLALTQHRRP